MANKEGINKGFSKFNALDNPMIGKKIYVIIIDVTGNFHFASSTIKAFRPGSLYVVEDWDNETSNLGIPVRLLARAEYKLNPVRTLEKMTSEVRMFGTDKNKLLKEWKLAWEKRAKTAEMLVNKYLYFADYVGSEVDFTNSEE